MTLPAAAACALLTTVALTACSSSTGGKGTSSAPAGSTSSGAGGQSVSTPVGSVSAPSTPTTPQSSVSSSSGVQTSAAGLATQLKLGLSSVTSAHLALAVKAAGENVTGAGDEKLSGGKTTALDISESLGSEGNLHMIILGTKVYIQLPASLNKSGKPWELATANSSNPVLKQLASTLASTESSASLSGFTQFAQAATNLRSLGQASVSGTAATHYTFDVDVAKLPTDNPGREILIQSGLKSIPVQLWVDGQGRIVKLAENITVGGASVSTVVTISKYNVPVTISAPPASEVSTK